MRTWCVRPVSNSISSHAAPIGHGERPVVEHRRPAVGVFGRDNFGLRLAVDLDQIILPRPAGGSGRPSTQAQ